MTVHCSVATRSPIRSVNADVPLRLKSPSSPWPIASCNRIPGQPEPSTTVMLPAGEGTASMLTAAERTASDAISSGRPPFKTIPKSPRPPPPA